jgi:hypothetical protein
MPSYVIVWENNTFGHRKVEGRTWPGHAAMNIGGIFDKGAVSVAMNSYVSWWPSDGASFGVKDLMKSVFTSQKGDHNPTIIDDIGSEGYLPDHVIFMNSSDDSEANMKAEWRTVFNKPGGASYKNLRKNCSTIVSRVLHAGGFHAKKWAVDCNFVWTPADVRKLAEGAGGGRMTWAQFLDVLQSNGIAEGDLPEDEARSGIYCSTGAPCRYQAGAACAV